MSDSNPVPSASRASDDALSRTAGITVLLVDDSSTIRRSARACLESEGYTVITAVDGFDALAKVVEHRPSLVFADIMMPRLDGYQTCALIKNNADYRDIPVIMLSSRDGLFDKARARVVGSDDHLSKPFTAQTLADAVRRHTGRKSAERTVSAAPDSRTSEKPASSAGHKPAYRAVPDPAISSDA